MHKYRDTIAFVYIGFAARDSNHGLMKIGFFALHVDCSKHDL